jgi:capsular polysaccharide biosynthesis protein
MYDSLPRLIQSFNISNACIILPEDYKNIDYVKSSLEILQFNNIQYSTPNCLFLFKSLSFPTHSAPTGNFDPPVIKELRKKLLTNILKPIKIYDKIYISREKSIRRKVINETDLTTLLKQHGFHVLCMEDYTWKEQMYIFMSCSVLIGIHGAGLSNMIFMKERSKVIEIRKHGDKINNCYFSLAAALNHDYLYLQAQTIGASEFIQENNFIVDLNELNSILSIHV